MEAEEMRETARQAELVYQLMLGGIDRQDVTAGAAVVEELFARGAPFGRLYDEMLAAYDRLADRLHPGEEEDADVEVFFQNFLAGCEYVGLRMYGYGRYYALHPEQFPKKVV